MLFLQRLLSPIVELRRGEGLTALLMFAYSFLAMASYNAVKPLTRSQLIQQLGADNIPYVLLASGFVIGILMTGYAWLMSWLPRRWGLPIVQSGLAVLLFGFWLLFGTGSVWVPVAFYVAGQILGLLLISQFWTLANVVYDPRQAKRLFGFIGGGAPLGGIAGSALAAYAPSIGSVNLLIPSAILMVLCALLVAFIVGREKVEADAAAGAKEEKGVGITEAFDLLRQSKHLQIIALVISLAAVGAAIIEQQLNMAAEAAKGSNTDGITAFLAWVGLWTSSLGLIIQVWLTSRIHRYLGIGVALMILPVSLGATAVVMLFNAALWAPGLARVLDQLLRYTVDKTTREILFLPLPSGIKLKGKAFVDVTVDRGAKAGAALLLIVLVQPWGLNLDWQRLSYASLAMTALWIVMALRARHGYLSAFRQSIERRDLAPAEVRLNAADLSTIETLLQEMAHPDPARVVYAIDVLESLDKRNLVTPLLLYHESPAVRERALRTVAAAAPAVARQCLPQVRRTMSDPESSVRASAVAALGHISGEDAAALARPLLDDADPRIRATAAVALAASGSPQDALLAESALLELSSAPGEAGRTARRDVAIAVRGLDDARFRRLLIPLLYDPAPDVADAAMESVQAAGTSDFIFVPTLVALLRHRQLKGRARAVLVSYGEAIIEPLAHFLRDQDEDVWVRRHIPGTLAQIPSQRAVDVLVETLDDPDGFLRFKAIAGLERLRQSDAPLTFPREAIEKHTVREANRYFNYYSLHHNVFGRRQLPANALLARALEQKMVRARARVYHLLGLIYPWKDIAAAQWTLEHGEPRARASASEYLDNLLTGQLRRRIMPLLEELPEDEKVRRANVLLRTRPRDTEETLLSLINDEDQVIAAAAIDLVRQAALWNLGDDIEHVLAHRDARDWYVFEAASWALAERRMPAERRRELWLEPLPAAELAGRLTRLPLFASVTVDELFRIAGTSRQVRHESGAILAQDGAAPETVHLLIDGRVTASGLDGHHPIEAPAALGLTEALQGQAMRQTLRTSGVAVTLALGVEELRVLLADNTELVRGLFSTIADQTPGAGLAAVPTGERGRDLERLAADGVQAVEKVLALERVPVFARLSVEEGRHLADIAHTVSFAEGATLFEEAAPPAIWVLLAGQVGLSQADGPQTIARAGDVLGAIHALAGRPLGRAAVAVTAGAALRIDGDDLFELLGERPYLLRQLFAGMFALASGASGIRSRFAGLSGLR